MEIFCENLVWTEHNNNNNDSIQLSNVIHNCNSSKKTTSIQSLHHELRSPIDQNKPYGVHMQCIREQTLFCTCRRPPTLFT